MLVEISLVGSTENTITEPEKEEIRMLRISGTKELLQ